jgi:ribosome-binding factor A
MATQHRVDRVREQLLREVSDIVGRLKDPRVHLVTVVDTAVSRDLRQATLYVSLIGTREQQRDAVEGLNHALGFIRREVAQRIQLRQVPELRVVYDTTSERAARISALIDQAVALENRSATERGASSDGTRPDASGQAGQTGAEDDAGEDDEEDADDDEAQAAADVAR